MNKEAFSLKETKGKNQAMMLYLTGSKSGGKFKMLFQLFIPESISLLPGEELIVRLWVNALKFSKLICVEFF